MLSLILFIITLIFFLLNLLREVFVLRDIKSNFYCKYCGTFNNEVSSKYKCDKCKKQNKVKGNSWEHLILHRVNWIPSNNKKDVFKWKDYKKLSVIEITVNVIAIVILIIAIIFNIIGWST